LWRRWRSVPPPLARTVASPRASPGAQVPTLATAAEYFFKEGALGKRMRPTVLLLVASALSREPALDAADTEVDHSPPREPPQGARSRWRADVALSDAF